MPGAKGDGSITIDSRLDNKGFSKGSEELKNAVGSLKNRLNKTGEQIRNAFSFDFGQPKQAANTFGRALNQLNEEIRSLGEVGKRAMEGDENALARFRNESEETLQKLQEMKIALGEFGNTSFETKEHKDWSDKYQKATAQVEELSKALEEAEASLEKMTNDFGQSQDLQDLEDRIDVLRMYKEEFDEATRSGDLRGQATAMMESGVGKGTIDEAIKDAEAEMANLYEKFEDSAPFKKTEAEIEKITADLAQAKEQAAEYKKQMETVPATFKGEEAVGYDTNLKALEKSIDSFMAQREAVNGYKQDQDALRQSIDVLMQSLHNGTSELGQFQQKWKDMPTLSGMVKDSFTDAFEQIKGGINQAGAAVYTGLNNPIQSLNRALGSLANGALTNGSIKSGLDKIASSAKKAASNLAGMVKGTVIGGLKKLGSALSGVRKNSNSATNSLKGSLKTMLKYGLGIRSFFILFKKLRSAVTDGFGAIAKYDPEFKKTFNGFKNSLDTLKNSLAAAFIPIAEVVMPLLTRLFNTLTEGMTKIGMFIAALTGKDSFIAAAAQQKDYTAETNKSTKATKKNTKVTKENQKTIAGFDDVEILKDKSKETETPAGYQSLPIDKSMKDLADKVKDKIKGLMDVFKKAWDQEGLKTIAAMKYALNSILGLLKTIGQTFYDVFTDGYGFDWLVSVLRLLQTIFYIIGDIANAFNTAWQNDGNGYKMLAQFFVMLTNINNLLIVIGESFREAWNSGLGVSIAEHLLHIFTNLFAIVGNLAEALRKAWEDNGNGVRIWTAILGIIDSVLGTIDDITLATAEWAKDVNFSPVLESVGNILEKFKNLVDLLGGTFKTVWTEVLLPFASWTIEEFVPVALDAIGAALDLIASVGKMAGEYLKFIWDNFFSKIASGIGDIVIKVFKFLSKELELISQNELAVNVLTEVAGAVGLVVAALKIAPPVITAVKLAFAALTSPIGLVIAAIAALTIAVAAIITHWDKVKPVLSGVGKFFLGIGQSIVDGFIKPIVDFFKGIGTWIKSHIFDPFINGIKSAFGISSPSKQMETQGGYIVDGMLKGIMSGMSGIVSWIKDHIFTPFIDGVKNLFGLNGGDSKMGLIGGDLITGLKNGIINKMAGISNWVGEHITGPICDNVKSLFGINSPSTVFRDYGGNLTAGLEQGIDGGKNDVTSTLTGLASDMKSKFNGISWSDLGTNIANGIANGVKNNLENLKTTAWNLAVGMYNSACKALGIASPSKKFAWIGDMMTAGLAEGIDATQDNAVSAVTSLADAVTEEAESAQPTMLIDSSIAGFDGVLSNFSDKVVRSFDAMVAAMEAIVNGSAFTMPAVASGSVMPYSARRAGSQGDREDLSSLIQMLSMGESERITRADLVDILTTMFREYMRFDFRIGDEQIARHANAGNAKLDRRYNPVKR